MPVEENISVSPSVAVYISGLEGGGVERMRLLLVPEFILRGWHAVLLVGSREGELIDSLPPGLQLMELGGGRTLADILPLARYLRRHRPDVLLSSLGHNNMVALVANALAFFPSKVIITQHNALSREAAEMGGWKYKLLPLAYRLLFPLSAGIVAVSKGVAADMARVARIPAERIRTIYNPVVDRKFDARSRVPVSHPWLDGSAVPIFVSVGRLTHQKDHDTLLRAFQLYRRSQPGRLLILGAGPRRHELEMLAQSYGLGEDDVRFEGFVENPLALVRHCHALVLSSRYEGFANVIVEALACGVAVISTDCPFGPSEILADGVFGQLVPVGAAELLTEAMTKSLSEGLPPEVLVERTKEFTLEKAAMSYIALFNEVSNRG